VQAQNLVQPEAPIVSGIVQPGPKLADGGRYVQTTDIVEGRIQVQSLCRTSEEIASGYQRSSIRGGDVLLGIIRALKVAVVPDELDGANISRSVARLRPREGVVPEFLAFALQSPIVQDWLRAQHRGMDMPVLNLSEVRLAPIPLPPSDEQSEIVRRVNSLFARADAVNVRYTEVRALITRLTPALLAKAFRGELVPQDSNDEPASALLASIAAQRGAPAIAKRTRAARVGRMPRAPKEIATMTKSRRDDDVMGQPYLAGHLRRLGAPASAEALFKVAELPVADFYKQLAWEVAQGNVKDNQTTLEPGHAAG
jgi:type I restriction enzyme S subunit